MTPGDIADIESIFTSLGGQFTTPAAEILQKLKGIKAYVFDWDGVFNNGVKSGNSGSPYAEADSMGTNMLRFEYWMRQQELPVVAIITGASNKTAEYLGNREHFHGMFVNYSHKQKALEALCHKYKLKESEVAYFFDDILDIEVEQVERIANAVYLKGKISVNGRIIMATKFQVASIIKH